MDNNNQVNEPVAEYNQPTDFQQVWRLFIETDKQFRETDKKIKETDRILTEKFQETDKKIQKLSELFTSQWGKLVESLVEGDLVNLLKAKGIAVESVIQRRKGAKEGVNFEFDLIAVNTDEIVIVEVKTTLRTDDVDHFHKKLWKAKTFMPEYSHMRVYGAVAFINVDSSSDSLAENMGVFVIRATGSSSAIINKEGFKPKVF